MRTEPICSRNKCREHKSVRGVRWCQGGHEGWRVQYSILLRNLVGKVSSVRLADRFDSCTHIPKNCNLRKFVSLTLKSSAKGILLCSSHKRRIGCMLRQHSLSLRRPPCYRYGGAAFKRMIGMDILKSVRYYDDDDELYCEYDITFEYNGKKYLAIHFFAFSGAWNKKLIGHIPDGFERLYGGGVSDFSFKDTTFTYGELIEAAELLEFSGKEELCYADYEGDGNDNEAKKFREQMQNLQIPR